MHRHISNLLFFMFVAILFTQCQNSPKTLSFKNGKSYNTQTVYAAETIAGSESESFAFYLPKQYDGKTLLPLVYLIDPHAEGSKPIEKYKQAADEMGYILVASNALQNGLTHTESSALFNRLKSTVESTFVFDLKRQFTGGFSGGAKLAMMFAFENPSIIGTVACGGTLPIAGTNKPTFYYAGIVGEADFNYLECRQTFSVFENYGYDYTALVFNGGHEWPPLTHFKQALQGFDIYAMKMKLTKVDKKKLEMALQNLTDSANLYGQQNRLIDQYEQLQQINRWFYGLQPITETKKQILTIQNSPEFARQLQTRQQAIQKEVSLRTQFVRAIGTNDLDWWRTEIGNFDRFDSKNADLLTVKKRLLNYLSMVSFSLVKSDLDAMNLADASKKIEIYQMVDPQNYDVYLMRARYFMLAGDTENMKINYQKAIDLGFKSVTLYAKDQAWRPLLEQMNAL